MIIMLCACFMGMPCCLMVNAVWQYVFVEAHNGWYAVFSPMMLELSDWEFYNSIVSK